MQLLELHLSPDIARQLALLSEDSEQLDEAIWDTLKTGFAHISTAISTVARSSGTKSGLNDDVLGKIYRDELAKFKGSADKLPAPASQRVWALLSKADIKPTGVDLSRKNLNRILIVKIMRMVVYTMTQMRDNGVEWLLTSAVSGGLGTIISLLMNAKDYKALMYEFSNSMRQIKALYDKAKTPRP